MKIRCIRERRYLSLRAKQNEPWSKTNPVGGVYLCSVKYGNYENIGINSIIINYEYDSICTRAVD